MKLCIPVSVQSGLDSLVEPHLPHAEHLCFFDTETRLYEEISLIEQQAGGGADMLIDAVLCASINRITLRTLLEQGVKIYGTQAQTVAQAIAEYENGELEAVELPAGGCSGHGHEHEHEGGGCCSGHGSSQGGQGCGSHGGGCGGQEHSHSGGGCCAVQGNKQAPAVRQAPKEILKIAVCSQNRKTVTEHAGKCRKFWVYDIKQGQVTGKTMLELPIEQALHSTPDGEPHQLDEADVLIAASMGSGLQQRLLQRGIHGVVTEISDPDQVVAAFLAGEI